MVTRQARGGTEHDRRLLRAAKRNATALHCIPLAMFVGSFFIQIGPFEHFLEAAGEAGTVGGLADWFAVVALFRRPLGLPIPHTALIPNRKDAIGAAIGRFVESNFLDEMNLLSEFRKNDRALQIGRWLNSEATSYIIAESVAGSLQQLVRKGVHLDLASTILPAAKSLRKALGGDIEAFIAKLTGRFMPSMVDRYLTKQIGSEIDQLLDQLNRPGSPERLAMDAWIRMKLERMPARWQDPAVKIAQELNAMEILSRIGTGEPSQDLVESLSLLIARIGQAIVDSEEMRRSINRAGEEALVQYIAPFGQQISDYITSVVRNWSSAQITEAIELQVGKDLQFIRINGTVVGMAAGIALFALGEILKDLRSLVL